MRSFKPKKIRFIVHLIFFVVALLNARCLSGQRANTEIPTKEQTIKRFLENGAWRVRYFSPEYQLYIDSAILENPNVAYLYQQKAMPYFKQSKYEQGLKYLDIAVKIDPKTHIDYAAFIKCIFVKNYTNAIADFQTAKLIKGANGFVMDHSYDFYLGLCYLQLNQFEKALPYFENSINQTKKTNGENWVHYLDLHYFGITLQELNRHKEAIEAFDKALVSYPNFSDAKYYKAISLFRLNQSNSAEQLLTESESDFKKGFTINEDNSVYEKYPYQLKQFYIDMLRMTKK